MLIVKLSGKALSDLSALGSLFGKLKEIEDVLLVHGGGVEVDQILSALNFTTTKLNGIRVSPAEQMPYIAGTLAGQCNKQLQAVAIAHGLNAIGMLCTDYAMCALKPYPAEYGQVASVEGKDGSVVRHLMQQGVVPVIASIGIDSSGALFNVNADEVAAALAQQFAAPLVFLSDVPGVLDAKGQVIKSLDPHSLQHLSDTGVITDGMLVKVQSALKVAQNSGQPVFIASIFDHEALNNLASLQSIGTTLCAKL